MRVQKKKKGSLCIKLGVDLSFLALGEVETRGSTQYVGKPLPQYKPSKSRHDATSEKMEKLRPKKLCENY